VEAQIQIAEDPEKETFLGLMVQFFGAFFGVFVQIVGRVLIESEVYLIVFSPSKVVSGILLWGWLEEPAFLALSLWGAIDFASVIILLIARDREDRSLGQNVHDGDSL
jgi:hypothetical protein